MKNPACMTFQLLVTVIIIAEVQGKPLAGCVPKQFVEYRTRGLILCQFPQDEFDSIYWYDNTNVSEAEPTLTYDGKEKNGDGYFSGEFDIHDNGTLIINNVSLLHEKNFKVVWFLPSELFNTYHIEMEVTVTPTQMFPRINNCSDTKEVCNIRVPRSGNLTCSVNRAKPASQLEWFMVVDGKEKRIETLTNIIPDSNFGTYHSSAVIVLGDVSATYLGLFVCSSRLKQFDKARSKKVLIDMLNETAVTTMPVLQLHREMGRRAELKCALGAANMFLWRKVLSNENQLISFSVLDDVYVAPTQIADHFEMRSDGTLFIESSKIDDEGKFICLSSDGVESNVAVVELLIIVPPSPSYIVMDGCSTGLCSVAVNETKALTCTVTGARPPVLLQWHIIDEEKITITNQDYDVLENMGLYDTKASLQFEITTEASCGDILTATCQATGAATELFRASKDQRFEVICTEKRDTTEESEGGRYLPNEVTIIFLFILAVLLGVFVIVWPLEMRRLTRKVNNRKAFIEELETTYKQWVSPKFFMPPTQDDRTGERIYIPNTISEMEYVAKSSISPLMSIETWENVISRLISESRHVVLEGDSGSGKTQFALNIVKQWLKSEKTSVLQDFPILIFLSLRHHYKNDTIYNRIKDQLLAKDSKLTNDDIREILQKEDRYLMILDDFDCYSFRSDFYSDVRNIMKKRTMRNANALVLTRPTPSTMPLKCDILFLRLQLFSVDQISQYLDKLSNSRGIDVVKERMNETDYIKQLCRIPLFLSIIAKILQTTGTSPTTSGMSDFASSFVDSLRSHIRETVGNNEHPETARTFDYAKIQIDLGELAIAELAGNRQSSAIDILVKIETELGTLQPLYDMRVFKLMDVESRSETPQFAHDFFRYFFGAHYLTTNLDKLDTLVENVDENTVEMLLMLMCGFAKKSDDAEKIIRHLLQMPDMYPHVIRDCIVMCFKEAKVTIAPGRMKQLLEEICEDNKGLQMKRNMDSSMQMNAKSSFITMCAEHKVTMNVLSFTEVVSNISKGNIAFDTGCSCNIPEKVRYIFISDLMGNLTDFDIASLADSVKSTEQIVVFSKLIPSICQASLLKAVQEKKMTILWTTYEDDRIIKMNYLSCQFRKWLSFDDTLKSTDELSKHEYLSRAHCQVMSLVDQYVNELKWANEATTDDQAKEHDQKLKELTEKVIAQIEEESFAKMFLTNIQGTNDSDPTGEDQNIRLYVDMAVRFCQDVPKHS